MRMGKLSMQDSKESNFHIGLYGHKQDVKRYAKTISIEKVKGISTMLTVIGFFSLLKALILVPTNQPMLKVKALNRKLIIYPPFSKL